MSRETLLGSAIFVVLLVLLKASHPLSGVGGCFVRAGMFLWTLRIEYETLNLSSAKCDGMRGRILEAIGFDHILYIYIQKLY